MIYLSLGSNLGNREEYLEKALEFLGEKCIIVKRSSIIETKPVGFLDQPDFLNMCVAVETSLNPYGLLDFCLSVEKKLGRKRTIKNGPRVIDVDILLYNDLKINSEKLVIPHPRMYEREFVMKPLNEIQ